MEKLIKIPKLVARNSGNVSQNTSSLINARYAMKTGGITVAVR